MIKKYPDGLARCSWLTNDPLYIDYHDIEWGVPVTEENALFERVCLEGFQAGLSWITILKRRDEFRKAFHAFEIKKVARLTEQDIERLMQNNKIIRNRAKITATISNAKACLALDRNLSEILWSHVPDSCPDLASTRRVKVISVSKESQNLSRELKKLGFSFVGPTSMYALMQSIGMINDHAPGCFRRDDLQA